MFSEAIQNITSVIKGKMKRDLPTQMVCVSSSSKSFPSNVALQEHSRAGPSWVYRQQALREEPSSLSTRNVCILAA